MNWISLSAETPGVPPKNTVCPMPHHEENEKNQKNYRRLIDTPAAPCYITLNPPRNTHQSGVSAVFF